MIVNIYEAKTRLSFYLNKLIQNEEDEIVIARNGTPIAKLVPYTEPDRPWGLLKNKKIYPMSQEEFDSSNDSIAEMFGV